MSNSFWEKLNKLREIKLDENRKAELRSNLIEFIERDVRADVILRHQSKTRERVLGTKKSIWNQLISSNSLLNFNPMSVLVGLLIAVMAGGGVSFAAENSLPGDVLYPVKITINEEVRGAIAFSPEAKAEWDARRAERRLEEAAELTTEGKMSADLSAKIEKNFEAHAKRVEDRIARFESENKVMSAADLASKFETSLKVHDQILERLALRGAVAADLRFKAQIESTGPASSTATSTATSTIDNSGLVSLKIRIRQHITDIEGRRIKFDDEIRIRGNSAEVKAEVKAAAEGKIGAAKNVIASVRSYIENQKAKLGAGATADAEARLTVAEGLVAQAEAKLASESFGEAFILSNGAIRVAQAAKLLINASTELDLKMKFLGPNGGEVEIEVEDDDDGDNDEDENEVRSTSSGQLEIESETKVDSSGKGSGGTSGSGSLRLKIGL